MITDPWLKKVHQADLRDTIDTFVEIIANGTPISFEELLECFDYDPDGEATVAALIALDLYWDTPIDTVLTVDDLKAGLIPLGTSYETELKCRELQMVIDGCEMGIATAGSEAEESHFGRQLIMARSALQSIRKGA